MRVEVIKGKERRRRWSVAEKEEIVAKTEAGAMVSSVAREHGVHPNQVSAWRRERREGLLGGAGVGKSGVVAVCLSEPPEAPSRAGLIEIVLASRCLIRVDREVDRMALRRVLDALEGR